MQTDHLPTFEEPAAIESPRLAEVVVLRPPTVEEAQAAVAVALDELREAERIAHPSALPRDVIAQVESLHQAGSHRMNGLRRLTNRAAIARADEARAAERTMLERLGYASYSDFRITMTGVVMDEQRRSRLAHAHRAVEIAEAELISARQRSRTSPAT